MNKNILWAAVIVAVGLVGLALVGGNHQSANTPSGRTDRLAGVTNYDSVTITPTIALEGLKVGTSSPSTANNIILSKCDLSVGIYTVAATSTRNFDCAVSGIRPNDFVFVSATSTGAVGGSSTPFYSLGWMIAGANASTTAGTVTVGLTNLTGSTAYPPAWIASSTQLLIITKSSG